MADTPKPISNIAGVGAELPMTVAVDGEFLPTGQAGKGVDSLTLHQVKVAVPPLVPAGIAAEPFPLPPRILSNGLSALLAYCPGCFGYQAVPSAERLHRVDRNLELCRYPSIPRPIPAQDNNLLFLFVRHDGHLLKIWSSGVIGQNGYR
jgi:hypothetical protein